MLSYVVVCKGRLHHLKVTLPILMRMQGEVIVVDDNCPDGTADWVAANHPAAVVQRFVDGQPFNLSRARNSGAATAKGDWLCLIDADVCLRDGFSALVSSTVGQDCFFSVRPFHEKRGIGGTCVVRAKHFHRIGGYDEVIVGWGGEDTDLYHRLRQSGLRHILLPHDVVEHVLRHEDAERNRFYGYTDTRVSDTINTLYRLAKHYLSAMAPGAVDDVATRKHIREAAEACVKQALQNPGRTAPLRIALPPVQGIAFYSSKVKQSLVLEVNVEQLMTPPSDVQAG